MPWRDWQDDIERQFNPRAWATDVEAQHALRGKLSAAARACLKGEFNVAYGDSPRQALDIYHADEQANEGPAPIVVYLHGGYWRVGEKEKQAVLAGPLVEAGFPVVMLGTDLCPAVTLDTIVPRSCAASSGLRRMRNASVVTDDASISMVIRRARISQPWAWPRTGRATDLPQT